MCQFTFLASISVKVSSNALAPVSGESELDAVASVQAGIRLTGIRLEGQISWNTSNLMVIEQLFSTFNNL